MLSFHQAISPFERQISKTGFYTNAVCCEVKLLLSERNPGPSAAPNSFRDERVAAFFVSFLFIFSRFVA